MDTIDKSSVNQALTNWRMIGDDQNLSSRSSKMRRRQPARHYKNTDKEMIKRRKKKQIKWRTLEKLLYLDLRMIIIAKNDCVKYKNSFIISSITDCSNLLKIFIELQRVLYPLQQKLPIKLY